MVLFCVVVCVVLYCALLHCVLCRIVCCVALCVVSHRVMCRIVCCVALCDSILHWNLSKYTGNCACYSEHTAAAQRHPS